MGSAEVVVVGGGYAGVMAANRLTQRADVAVTLVNPRASFVERIRLHQLVGGSDDAVVDYRDVLARSVRLVVDTATRIDVAHRRVELASGSTLTYDHLVYAVGSASAATTVPGASEHALPIATYQQAQRLQEHLHATPTTAPITVVGAGPTGIETAAELAKQGRAVTLVCGEVLGPYLHPRGRRAAAERLAELGVAVHVGVAVTAVGPDAVQLSGGLALPRAVMVWTAGFSVPDLAARSGLTTDAVGRLLTDETLTSVDDDRIVAAADCAAPAGLGFRMSCQAAGPLGGHAADTVLRRIAGEQPAPVAMAFVGQCLSLGRRTGLLQLAHRDDTAGRAYLAGRAAGRIKELVCQGTVAQRAFEARRPGLVSLPAWAADGWRRGLREARRREALATARPAATAGAAVRG